ncbi:MAG: hypothetical protein ACTSRK_08020, partial [Promethearchaeota archaeon]
FTWESIIDAEEYQIQIDDSSTCTSPLQDTYEISTTYTATTLVDDIYYWRVRACDEAGNWGDWSGIWTFEVDSMVPNTPLLLNPIHGAILNDPTPNFTWESIIDAEEYQIQIDDSSTCTSPLQDTYEISTTYTAK